MQYRGRKNREGVKGTKLSGSYVRDSTSRKRPPKAREGKSSRQGATRQDPAKRHCEGAHENGEGAGSTESKMNRRKRLKQREKRGDKSGRKG